MWMVGVEASAAAVRLAGDSGVRCTGKAPGWEKKMGYTRGVGQGSVPLTPKQGNSYRKSNLKERN